MGLFNTGQGSDALNIAGHKVPVSALGVMATILAAILVLRARSRNANLVALGPTGTAADPTVYDPGGYNANSLAVGDLSTALASLQDQLSQLQGLNSGATTSGCACGGATGACSPCSQAAASGRFITFTPAPPDSSGAVVRRMPGTAPWSLGSLDMASSMSPSDGSGIVAR